MTETVRNFHDLRVWQKAMDLVAEVYRVAKKLPGVERFVLTQQLLRAVLSVPANIAEGQGRRSTADFLRHLVIARGSLAEVETLLLVAQRLSYLTEQDMDVVATNTMDVRMLLSGLISRLQQKDR